MKRSLAVQLPTFIAIRTVIGAMIRMVYPFLPIFGRGLGVDLGTLSMALMLRSASGALGPFLASVADSRGRKAGMLFGLILFTLGAGLMVFWPTFPVFVLTLILTSLGNFVFIPSMQAYLGDWVPYRRRGQVSALAEFGWALSFIIGVPLMGMAIARQGWQAPFLILTGLGALALIVLAAMLPKDEVSREIGSGLWKNLRNVFTCASAVAGISIAVFLCASNELVNLIFGVWLEETFAVKIAALAAASAVIGFSELGGESLVSVLVDRLGKRRSIGIGMILNGLAGLLLPVVGCSLGGALAGLFILYLTFEFALVSCIPLMTEILPHARATLMATFIAGISMGRGLGAILSPPLYQADGIVGGLPGIWNIVIVAGLFNLLALVLLQVIKIPTVDAPASEPV